MKKRHPSQPRHLSALDLDIPPRSKLDPDLRKYFDVCDEKGAFPAGTAAGSGPLGSRCSAG